MALDLLSAHLRHRRDALCPAAGVDAVSPLHSAMKGGAWGTVDQRGRVRWRQGPGGCGFACARGGTISLFRRWRGPEAGGSTKEYARPQARPPTFHGGPTCELSRSDDVITARKLAARAAHPGGFGASERSLAPARLLPRGDWGRSTEVGRPPGRWMENDGVKLDCCAPGRSIGSKLITVVPSRQ